MKRPFAMIARTLPPLLAAAALAGCSALPVRAKTDFNLVGQEMAGMLQNSHYARPKFDEKLSGKIFDTYLDQLDISHIFFTQEDITRLRAKYGTSLHKLLMGKKCMVPATEIHTLFTRRVEERLRLAKKILAQADTFTFDSDRTTFRTRKDAPWPADEKAAEALWRNLIEEALLSETLRRDTVRKLAAEQGKPDPLANEPEPAKKVLQRYDRLLRTFQDQDEEDIANAFLSAVALAHDPHTDYQSAREMDRFETAMSNSLVGIGALLRAEDDGATRIMGIVVNGPADKQGDLKLNDRIIGVDPAADGNMQDIMFRNIDHVVDLIRGKKGRPVTLKIEPADGAPGETRLITITRDRVEMKDEAASAEIVKINRPDGGQSTVGWLTLPSFYIDFRDGDPSVATDVRRLLERLNREKTDGLVIDLRGNGGGSLEEVVRITSYFTGRSPVVQIKDAQGRIETRVSTRGSVRQPLYTGPLLVITNKASASASEILAGALQDYKRAVVVGSKSTFGKGTVQQIMPIGQFFGFFSDARRAGALKPTIQKFYRVAGSSTQLKGVVPDIHLPSLMDAMDIGEDTLPHALPHDRIAPARGFTPLDPQALHLPVLLRLSAQRVAASKDFAYITEDIQRAEKERAENQVSLNKAAREKEIADSNQRRRARNAERLQRFAAIEKQDAAQYEFYRLGLDDLDKEQLEKVNREQDAEAHMRTAKEDLDELDDTPEWPSALDPVKRESLHIIADLINATRAAATAAAAKPAEKSQAVEQ